ncbi:hypothetical protein [Shewanella halifaxensis]|uniref:hypothetical protein n=1 Tax=Shewanella halifaxensis TaxID=271098 RepID=UPI000D595DE2|nr:hypothetical protein [Shewanella halifaxensis]
MRSNKVLIKTVAFWVAFLLPLISASVLALLMAYYGDVRFAKPTPDNILFAYEFLKIPLILASLVFPAVAIVTSNHRSAQTLEQIVITHRQNTFSNYYSHRKAFFELLDSLEKDLSIKFYDKNKLYSGLFPNNSTLNVEVRLNSDEAEIDVNRLAGRLAEKVISFSKLMNKMETRIMSDSVISSGDSISVLNLYSTVNSVSNSLYFETESEQKLDLIQGGLNFKVAYEESRPLIHLDSAVTVLEVLCQFCHRNMPVVPDFNTNNKAFMISLDKLLVQQHGLKESADLVAEEEYQVERATNPRYFNE